MINILHPIELEGTPTSRLREMGLACRGFSGTGIIELSHSTAEVLYLIPQSATGSAWWPKLRTQLARANRLHVAWVGQPSTEKLIGAFRDGAHDVVSLDDTNERWHQAILGAVESQKLWLQLYGGRPLSAKDSLIGRSPAIQGLRQTIEKLGSTDVCVLVTGESGVGKERVAAALHQAGRGGPFIALNCAAVPKDLIEAELFGVERGAFTGALKARAGLVEQANGGTLFLDEIGEMESSVQPKLLRFLETRRARRVGGKSEYNLKTRIISATNRNLEADVETKRFRADLYYRLAEITLQVPPLRARPEDIPELALTFLRMANERFGKNFESLEPALIECFQRHPWPGNVRQLKSAVDRLALMFDGPVLRRSWWEDLFEAPGTTRDRNPAEHLPANGSAPTFADRPNASQPNQKQKRELARRLLAESDDNYSWVAGQLGINTSTLWRWRKAGKLG